MGYGLNIPQILKYSCKPRIYKLLLNSKKVDFVPGRSQRGGVKILILGRSKTIQTGRNCHFHTALVPYIHTQKNLGLGFGFGYETQTQNTHILWV